MTNKQMDVLVRIYQKNKKHESFRVCDIEAMLDEQEKPKLKDFMSGEFSGCTGTISNGKDWMQSEVILSGYEAISFVEKHIRDRRNEWFGITAKFFVDLIALGVSIGAFVISVIALMK